MPKLSAAALAATLIIALGLPAAAGAHGVAERADLPIPDYLFNWGAAVVLIVSFLLLALFWPKPKLEEDSWRPVRTRTLRALIGRPVQIVCGLIGVFLFVVVLWSGFVGVDTTAANFAPTFVYVVFWLGLVVLSLLLGNVYRAFNPWRAIAKSVAFVATKAAGTTMPAPKRYPEGFGCWPAVVGLFAFAALELVNDNGELPNQVVWATVVYSIYTWVGMAIYGIDDWVERGDAFSVYFGLYARIAPFEVRDGVLGVRRPLSGLTRFEPLPGTVAFVAVIIGSTSFDGSKEGPTWEGWQGGIMDFWSNFGLSSEWQLQMTSLVGLSGCVLLVIAFYELGIRGAVSVGGGFERERLSRAFIHTLVPIGLVYVAAHYMTLLLFRGQAIAFLASDPAGKGWDLFGTRDVSINYDVIGAEATWYWQLGLVIAGHVAALVLAHERALVLYDKPRQAVRSQYWMLGVMVGFTTFALWLLASANQ